MHAQTLKNETKKKIENIVLNAALANHTYILQCAKVSHTTFTSHEKVAVLVPFHRQCDHSYTIAHHPWSALMLKLFTADVAKILTDKNWHYKRNISQAINQKHNIMMAQMNEGPLKC